MVSKFIIGEEISWLYFTQVKKFTQVWNSLLSEQVGKL